LKEAAKLGLKLQWTKTGREIAKVMSRVDHGYSSSLQDWKNGKNVSDPENCSADLDKMFCDIKIACSEIEDGDKSKDSKQWRSHWADARTPNGKRWESDSNYTNDKNGKMCDYGAKCQRSDCWFNHPKGWSGGEWKVSANTTMKGKVYMAYEKINDGGKGGKGGKSSKGGKGSKGKGKGKGKSRIKKDCSVEGCNRQDWGKYCTPHFKQGLEKGYLLTKDGERDYKTFDRDGKRKREEDADDFGFNKMTSQQKLGVKNVMAAIQAQASTEIEGEDDQPSEPRGSVMDRLGKVESMLKGHANLAGSKQKMQVDSFIEELNKQ